MFRITEKDTKGPRPLVDIAFKYAGYRYMTRWLFLRPKRRVLFQHAVAAVVASKFYGIHLSPAVWTQAAAHNRNTGGDNVLKSEQVIIPLIPDAQDFVAKHYLKFRDWHHQYSPEFV